MPVNIDTVTLHFKDEDGVEIPDATFTIRRRLSHEGQMAYLEEAAKFDVSIDENGEPSAGYTLRELDISAITGALLRHGLVGLAGVLDTAGEPLPVGRIGELDGYLVKQITDELQRRNTKAGRDPNSGAPSDTSSSPAAPSQSSTTSTSEP